MFYRYGHCDGTINLALQVHCIFQTLNQNTFSTTNSITIFRNQILSRCVLYETKPDINISFTILCHQIDTLTLRLYFFILFLQAFDPDTVDDGLLRYSVIDGDSDVFSVDELTGNIKTRVSIASRKQDAFILTIQASDGNTVNDSAKLDIKVCMSTIV